MNRFVKAMLIAAGTLSVALGIVGIFVPMLPTTPFLLLAALCYARSSPRMLHWLNHNRWIGHYIRDYRAGRGIPLREKLVTITVLWLTIGVTVIFFATMMWARFLLIAIALAVTVHLLCIRTRRTEPLGQSHTDAAAVPRTPTLGKSIGVEGIQRPIGTDDPSGRA